MKALIVVLLAITVASAAAARLTPKPAAAIVRGTAARSLTELQGWMPMPAIHIPEFGKEMSIDDFNKLRAEGSFKMPEPSIPSQDVNWDDLKAQADKALEAARSRAQRLAGQGSPRESSNASTFDNQNSNNQQDAQQSTNDNKQVQTNQQEQKPEQKQEQQQPLEDQQQNQQQIQQTESRNPQDDCSKTDTSAYAVELCVNAVRTNPQAFQYPCNSWWLSTLARSVRSPLIGNSKLETSAQRQANDMARNSRINHVGSDGSSVGDRIRDAGYTTFPQAENIAMGQTSAHQVTMEWMCSEGHRKAIMSCEYDEVGTAVAQNGGTWYYAQNFGCSSGRCPVCDVA